MIDPPDNLERYAKYLTENRFFGKIARFSKRLGIKAVYWALVLWYALFSDKVPGKDRALILGALGYLVLPLDLIPDFIPAAGFTDDIAAITFAVWKVFKNITPEVRARADAKVRSIFGDYDAADIELSFPDYTQDVDEQ